MKTKLTFLSLLIFFIAWFSFITPQDRFADPDVFYHITTAKLISEQGPLTEFPWLDLTALGSTYADQHFLFHVLQIPFLQFLDPLDAARVSAITFAVLCLLIISIVFYKLNIKLWWLWPILLTLTQPFTTRLIQGKASPLAITLWFLGIVACISLRPKSPPDKGEVWRGLVAICSISFLFTLTHGGWILLPLSLLLILLGDLIYRLALYVIRNSKYEFQNSIFHILLASMVGSLAGLILHPNREAMFSFLKVQIFDIAIAAPSALRLGTEWNANNIAGSISMLGVFGIILLLTALAHIITKDKNPNQNIVPCTLYLVRSPLLLSPLLLLLFVASLKSLRFTEYFQPLLALVTALLASTVNWKEFLNKLTLPSAKYVIRNTLSDFLLPSIIVLSLLMIIIQHIATAYTNMHRAPRFLRDQYQTPMSAISAIAEPGDRVYHSMWDEFPILFYQDQRLRYISGLDPTFLYKASSTLALDYQNLVFNASTTQAEAHSLIHDRLQADFILIDHDRWPDLNKLISSDPRYQIIANGNGATAYQVIKSP